jgi:hypothetical protein
VNNSPLSNNYDTWMSLLKVSRFLQVSHAFPEAIRGLQGLGLSPIEKLAVSLQHPIYHWVHGSVNRILRNLSFTSITHEQSISIGSEVYNILVRAKAQLDDMQKRLAAAVPALDVPPSADCGIKAHKLCALAWKQNWRSKVSPALLHPDTPLPFDEEPVVCYLRSQVYGLDMNNSCLEPFIDTVILSGAFRIRCKIIDAAAAAIEAVYARTAIDRDEFAPYDIE